MKFNIFSSAAVGAFFTVTLLSQSAYSFGGLVEYPNTAPGGAPNSCEYFPSTTAAGEDRGATGDLFYSAGGRFNWCSQDNLNLFVSHYGMDENDWNEGFGWNGGACDVDTPFGRLMNAYQAVHNAPVNRPATNDCKEPSKSAEIRSCHARDRG